MRPRLARSLGLGIALATALSAGAASADAGSVEALKRRGNQAMLELNYADALAAYWQALQIDPDDASLYYNLGRALQARAEFPEALDAFETFRAKASPALRARVPKLDELLEEVRVRIGRVSVACSTDLPDAKVVVTYAEARTEATSTTGCGPTAKELRLSLPAKSIAVEVLLEHATQQAQPVRVAILGGRPPTSVTLSVVERATSGLLRVRVVPPGALVAVDGTPRGNSPVELSLPAGPHVLEVTANHHDAARIPVVVELGADKRVDVELARTQPLTSRWWFWTGAALLAAGAGATAYVLVARPERDAREGSIDPGQIQAPLVTF